MNSGFSTLCVYSDESSCSPSRYENHDSSLTPTQLLSLAIKKRKELYQEKHNDFRRELLHTGMIRLLCKHLGKDRASRKRSRRHRSEKRRWDVKSSHKNDKGSFVFIK